MPAPRSLCLLLAAALVACGGAKPDAGTAAAATTPAAPAGGLTDFQLQHGIGPVTEPVTLAAGDPALAKQGAAAFEGKCSACHKAGERYVGPALGGVVERRSPAFVMNMILAPETMYTRHPEVRKLLAEYMTQMPNVGASRDEARAIVEYLRTLPAPK